MNQLKVSIVYNDVSQSSNSEEGKAEAGVLEEVQAVHNSLLELGHSVTLVPLFPPLELAKQRIHLIKEDAIFNLFEGFDNKHPETEAQIADILFKTGLPCTGNTASSLLLALDKAKTKALLEKEGIKTPRFQILNLDNVNTLTLNYPCIVKPCAEDASHGLTEDCVVNDFNSLVKQIRRLNRTFGCQIIVEEFLEGREFNVLVMGNMNYTILPVSEIVYSLPAYKPKILTYDSKWEPNSIYFKGTKSICPANINDDLKRIMIGISKKAYQLLGCHGYARVDIRLDKNKEVNILEVNPNPDISPSSGAAKQAESAGMRYTKFVESILNLALEA
ncbi:MAG: ATP-grasp domain-containing protein [Chloroflexi bacterium]|nr:ATP-grasp domain-containing protein [Chloroflexota bacterium]